MTLLGARFPRLASLPHVPLVQETPVERLSQASAETGADLVKATNVQDERTLHRREFLAGDLADALARLLAEIPVGA